MNQVIGFRMAAAGALLAPALCAQSLAVPASDPVGIGRSGAGVAFGRSLEAAGLNSALLTTLPEGRSAFLALGEEFQSAQVSLQSNQKTIYSTDRNRFMPALGAAWRWNDRTVVGFRIDTPFQRHERFSPQTSTRFLGDEIDLGTLRIMVQGARSFGAQQQYSFGAEVGVVRASFAQGTTVRAEVPAAPGSPVSPGNPSQALVEARVRETGEATLFAAGLGFRWAINSRWTLGASAQGVMKGSLSLKAAYGPEAPVYYANDGFGQAALGIEPNGAALLAASRPAIGSTRLALPGRLTVGVRQRVNNLFTWEADLRHTRWNDMRIPSLPGLDTPSGRVQEAPRYQSQNALGLSLAGEMTLSKDWVVRGGFALDQGSRLEQDVDHLLGGGRMASFSLGGTYKAFGGELSAGYQVRISQDRDSTRLEGTWSNQGYRSIGTATRVENMGHLFSIGFKKTF